MTAHWLFTAGLGEGVVLGLAAAVGIVAVRGGRVPGWERRPVVRRSLWGRGALLVTAAVALQSLNLAFSGPGFLQFAGALVSGAGLITGAALMHRATQDRRRGPTAPTTTDPAS
ncbi:hypothetical protein OOK36_28025 [Streptomyces sp. NBC_00365]|uniref:hypothetical protein n=1 Tax=Streptomyces sp. NBC_00365 TaxID=2975726 RepID=UPI0022525F69|nr:hypothetical protein [Streptomyces sp. NBC_00365]MCX5092661.1 hypothetical protein [Streptomyces sp. NBC_00365]